MKTNLLLPAVIITISLVHHIACVTAEPQAKQDLLAELPSDKEIIKIAPLGNGFKEIPVIDDEFENQPHKAKIEKQSAQFGKKAKLAEIDMLLTPEQYESLYGGRGKKRVKRKATKFKEYRWKDGRIPYRIADGEFSYLHKMQIRYVMDEWQNHTCLTFVPATQSDEDKLVFRDGDGCYSSLGRAGGSQTISLEYPGCRDHHTIQHEMGHAIGLFHEHVRPDRESVIEILFENIEPDWIDQFTSYANEIDTYGIGYDWRSIMQYGAYDVSKNGKPTIRLRNKNEWKEYKERTRRSERLLSFNDIKIVNYMYECNSKCDKSITCDGEGYLNKDCVCVCKDGTGSCQRGGADTNQLHYNKETVHCDFEQSIRKCGFTDCTSGDSTPWIRSHYAQYFYDLPYGPEKDHTYGFSYGNYMHLFPRNRKAGEAARMRSGQLKKDHKYRASFWYYMKGRSLQRVASLNVYASGNNIQSIKFNSTNIKGTVPGHKWKKQNIELDKGTDFIIFEAIRDKSHIEYLGDVAIDDVTITCETCNNGESAYNHVIPLTKDEKAIGPGVSCNFEAGLCGFTQSNNDNFDWSLLSGTTPSSGTGPNFDHTLKNAKGHYIYIEATGQKPNARAVLNYILPPELTSHCLRFWYNMHGDHIGQLIVKADKTEAWKKIGNLKENEGDANWYPAKVTIPIGTAQMSFIGVRGVEYQGDIALDDITVSNGKCS